MSLMGDGFFPSLEPPPASPFPTGLVLLPWRLQLAGVATLGLLCLWVPCLLAGPSADKCVCRGLGAPGRKRRMS